MTTLLQAVLAFVLTVVLGGRIAHVWQARAAKEARFFEASKGIYDQMIRSIDEISDLVGRRIYRSQRLCLLSKNGEDFEKARAEYQHAIIEWNEKRLNLELAIRTRFRDTYLVEFEWLQNELSMISSKLNTYLNSTEQRAPRNILQELNYIRGKFFEFIQGMAKEARLLNQQMHFGVELTYDTENLPKLSTFDLFKLLIAYRDDGRSIVRPPSDFGSPVKAWHARFGIHE